MRTPSSGAWLLLAVLVGGLIWKSLPARTSPLDGPDQIEELVSAEMGGMTHGC